MIFSEYTLKGKLNLFQFLARSFVQMLFVFFASYIFYSLLNYFKTTLLFKKNILLKFLSDFILTWLYNFNMLCVMYTIKNSLKHANLFNFAETASFGPITSGVVLQWNSVCQL